MTQTVRTPLPVYSVGTIGGNAGSPVVAGVGTNWMVPADNLGNMVNVVMGGDVLVVGSQAAPIRSVDSATQVTLEVPLGSTINPGTAYRIIKYQPNQTGSVVAALLALQAMGSDATPEASLAVDNGAGRIKLRQSAAGTLQIAVGPTGAADAALVTALDISQAGLVTPLLFDAYKFKKAINSLMASFGAPTAVDALLAFTQANNSPGSNAMQAATSNIAVTPSGDYETLVLAPWLASLSSPPTIAQIRAAAAQQTS